MPKINMKNFAINGRCYDITNTKPFYEVQMNQGALYNWTTKSVNADTAMGMSHFHENRFVGKAAFVYSW